MCDLKICENCEQTHYGAYGSGRFCSSKCARGFSTKNKRSLINEKVSSSLTKDPYNKICPYCNNNFESKKKRQIYCSIKCSNNDVTDITKNKIRLSKLEQVKNGTHKGWQSRNIRSYAELFFENVLINNNINFSVEFKINKRTLGFNNASNYFLDFYLHDYNIDLEIDGKQHEQPDRKKSDSIRDEALTKYGIIVYRIKWKNPKYNENYIKNEINKFLNFLETFKTK